MRILARFGVPALLYVFLSAMVIFALFPAFFVVQAAFRPGQSLYTLTLSLWPDHPTFLASVSVCAATSACRS